MDERLFLISEKTGKTLLNIVQANNFVPEDAEAAISELRLALKGEHSTGGPVTDAVIKSRELVDKIIALVHEFSENEHHIKEQDLKTDFLILIGQHRHKFEKLDVADHSECVTHIGHGGYHNGLAGLLAMWVQDEIPLQEIILRVANWIVLP